jgi:ABC-type multidrug transport system fused ATPase/permease subunit
MRSFSARGFPFSKSRIVLSDLPPMPETYWTAEHFVTPPGFEKKLLFNLIKADKFTCIYCSILCVLSAVSGSISPFLLQKFVWYLSIGPENLNLQITFGWLLVSVCIGLLYTIAFQTYIQKHLMLIQVWINRVTALLLKNKAMQRNETLATVLTVDTEQYASVIYHFSEILRACLQIAICLGLLIFYLGFVSFFAIGAALCMIWVLKKKVFLQTHMFQDIVQARNERVTFIEYMLGHKTLLSVFSWTQAALKKVNMLRDKEEKYILVRIKSIVLTKLFNISFFLCVAYGSFIVHFFKEGEMEFSVILAMLIVCKNLEEPAKNLVMFLGEFSGSLAAYKRIEKHLNLEPIQSVFAQSALVVQSLDEFFTGNIYENIACYRQVDNEKLNHILVFLELVKSLEDCPAFLNQPVEERGRNLSGGEKQRLLFIRCHMSGAQEIVFCTEINAVPLYLKQKIEHLVALSAPGQKYVFKTNGMTL